MVSGSAAHSIAAAGRTKLTDVVCDYVRNYIIEHRLGPGEALPTEVALAEELKVSRGTVRESVRTMQALGLVEVRHGNGLFVRGFNLDALQKTLLHALAAEPSRAREFLQIRRCLEMAAFDMAVGKISKEQIQRLAQILDAWSARLDRGERPDEEHREFHQLISRVPGNDSMVALVDAYWVLFNTSPARELIQEYDRRHHLEDHRSVYLALRAGDSKLARDKLVATFEEASVRLHDWLAPRDSQSTRSK